MLIIEGDLIAAAEEGKETHIAHQTNCLTVHAEGFAAKVTRKWRWANPYGHRTAMTGVNGRPRNLATPKSREVPGKIRVLSSVQSDGRPCPKVICMDAQWAPGPVGKYDYPLVPVVSGSESGAVKESIAMRKAWFKSCLDELAVACKQNKIKRVAFPWHIGCGMAGGTWTVYSKMLEDFEKMMEKKYRVTVVLYRLPANKPSDKPTDNPSDKPTDKPQ